MSLTHSCHVLIQKIHAEGRSASMQGLANTTGWAKPEVQRVMSKLLQHGMVQRADEPRTRNGLFALTDKGREQLGILPLDGVGKSTDTLLTDDAAKSLRIAKEAVAHMGLQLMSSLDLATHLNCTNEVLDAALAPLVDAKKLVRVAVIRYGMSLFDYRRSMTWVPADGDFRVCIGATLAPVAKVGPVAAPEPAALMPGKPAMLTSPAPEKSRATHAAAPAQVPAARASAAAVAAQLGWLITAPQSEAHEVHAEVTARALDGSTAPNALEAIDPVCAVNSRGELAIDLGGGDVVKFPPAQTRALRRFLLGCPFIDQVAGGAA